MTLPGRAALRTVAALPIARWRPDAVSVLTLLGVLLFVIPARNTLQSLGAAGRPVFLLGLVLACAWLCTWLHPGLVRRGRQPVRGLLLIYLGALLAAYVAGQRRGLDGVEARASDRSILAVLALVGIALAAADGIPSRARLEVLISRIMCFGAVMALFGIVQYLTHEDYSRYLRLPGFVMWSPALESVSRGGGTSRVAGTASHYIEFGVVVAMVVPLALYRTSHAVTKGARQRAAGALVLTAAAAPLSVSRTAIIGLGCVLLVQSIVWSWRRRFNVFVWLVIGVGAFGAAVPGVLGTLRSLFLNYKTDPSYQGRIADYAVAQAYISERPWFGRGPGTFIPAKYFFLDNQYLGTILTSGYVGLAALVIVMLGGITMAFGVARRAADAATRELAQALAAMLVAVAAASYSFDSLSFPAFAGLFYLTLGVTGALWRLEQRPVPTPAGPAAAAPVQWRDPRGDQPSVAELVPAARQPAGIA
ncbi:O-antigen polymerase [Parafrankia sp. EAN1pec]|uniref:O-antigen ligase family protein n=1 Tax=Parafrankia sp. (strain EAN1pec) TaxID=298653 RepID=UPI00005410C7|nr:O-antigen polymerase [Frankia sp. EAN1pec]